MYNEISAGKNAKDVIANVNAQKAQSATASTPKVNTTPTPKVNTTPTNNT